MSIRNYKLYLIDLDGTIYNGEKKIDGSRYAFNENGEYSSRNCR